MIEPRRYWRVGNLVVLSVAVSANAAAMAIMFVALHKAELVATTPERRQYFGLLAMVAGLLLIFTLFCLALLSVRFFSFRLRAVRQKHPPTEYVDAWKLAGERFELAEQDHRDEEPPPETPPDEEGKDKGGGGQA